MNLFEKLPEGLLEEVVSRTSPVDACRLSAVAKSFRSAAESDFVWERFFPSDYKQIIDSADSFPRNINFAYKKDLFLFILVHPLLIPGRTMVAHFLNTEESRYRDWLLANAGFVTNTTEESPYKTIAIPHSFWLDKWSGKKCFMIPPLISQDEFYDWDGYWIALSGGTRFKGINLLECDGVIWLKAEGKISTSMLSPETTYTAYLVFEASDFRGEFNGPVDASVGIVGDESINSVICLNPHKKSWEVETDVPHPKARKDKWFEVELGDYFNKIGRNDCDLQITVMEVKSGRCKWEMIFQGFEIRPKGT